MDGGHHRCRHERELWPSSQTWRPIPIQTTPKPAKQTRETESSWAHATWMLVTSCAPRLAGDSRLVLARKIQVDLDGGRGGACPVSCCPSSRDAVNPESVQR